MVFADPNDIDPHAVGQFGLCHQVAQHLRGALQRPSIAAALLAGDIAKRINTEFDGLRGLRGLVDLGHVRPPFLLPARRRGAGKGFQRPARLLVLDWPVCGG